MRTTSFDKEALNITIHNLYPGLELTSPVYFSSGTTCHVPSSQKKDASNTMIASFGIGFKQKDFEGALLYKLQRRYATRTENQPNNSTAPVEDAVKNVYLLVVWDLKCYFHKFRVCLIECPDEFTWNEDKLWTLYSRYPGQSYKDHKSSIVTWLMHDNTVMKTRFDITYGSDYKLDIIISEGAGKYNMEEPVKINPKKLVLPLSMLIVLIYAVRLHIWPSFKLNIHNQCLNVDLVSPYITNNGLKFYRAPDREACAGNIMRSCFIVYNACQEPAGALICKLQRKKLYESTEIDQGTSSTAQLLVVWNFSRSRKLYANVLLIEHDKGFDWDKDSLRQLHCKNIDQFRLCPVTATETWSLDDNTTLMTILEIMNEDRTLDIAISEVERYNYAKKLVHIDPKR
jgi:hypothetical protein